MYAVAVRPNLFTIDLLIIISFVTDVVFTTKYHSGWCNFPSPKHPNWNSKEVGPHSDLTARLTNSIRAKGLRIGFHHSLKEWYNPLYMKVCEYT